MRMRAYELLGEMLELFREKLPQAEFREAWRPGGAGRLPGKLVAAGQVGSESQEGEEWSARLDFSVYVPRKEAAGAGEALIAAMGSAAEEGFPALAGVKREGFALDASTGLLRAKCSFSFTGSGGGVGTQGVFIGGVERQASGWKIQIDPGKALTAVGENEPFALAGGVCYTVKIEGADTKGLERLAGFTAVLGSERFERCRWKSLDEAGRSAVFISYHRAEGGG